MPPSLPELLASTPLSGANAAYVEALYEQYLRNPDSAGCRPGAATSTRWPRGQGGERAHGPVIAAVAARTQAGAVAPGRGAAAGGVPPAKSRPPSRG